MGKLVPRELEIAVVGLQHRLTNSTRNMLKERVEGGPISCIIEREPENAFDENALKVVIADSPYKGMHIGYIPRTTAAILSPAIDEGMVTNLKGELTDVDPMNGTAMMLMTFKAAVKIKTGKRKVA